MKLAYIMFNGITWLDLAGVYDPVSRLKQLQYLPDLSWDLCSFTNTAMDDYGLIINPTKVRNELKEYNAIIVPGGRGTRELQFDKEFINWMKSATGAMYKISVCTGSLLLGAAGFLAGKKATTHYQEYKTLAPYCGEVLTDRIVDDNNTITAGAVAASLDLGLYLCEKWAGQQAAEEIRKKMNYRGSLNSEVGT